MEGTEIYYTPAQIAISLQLNVLTIYHYIKMGQLSAVKFGRTYRVRKSDLETFIRSHITKSSKKV